MNNLPEVHLAQVVSSFHTSHHPWVLHGADTGAGGRDRVQDAVGADLSADPCVEEEDHDAEVEDRGAGQERRQGACQRSRGTY